MCMDTILYFYQNKNDGNAKLEPMITETFFPDFRIVKLGLSKAAVNLLEHNCPYEEEHEKNAFMRIICGILKSVFKGLYEKRRSRCRQRLAQQQKEKLLNSVLKCWGDECTTACVCRPPITYFDKWKFTEYMDNVWVNRLLAKAVLPYYVVIGNFAGLREILFPRARRMKELIIYVTEGDRSEELDDITEELYDEYGLTPQLQIIEQDNYKSLVKIGFMPCNVLDFSEETRLWPGIVPAGSRWFDFGNSDDKRRKIESIGADVIYFSMMDMFENPEKYDRK